MEFTTKSGHTYQIHYDLPRVRDIKKATSVDLLTNAGVRSMASDLIVFAEVLFHSVKDQVERYDLDEDDFIRSLEGVEQKAADCWLRAYADFGRRVGKNALARLAENLVMVERESEKLENESMDDRTAKRVSKKLLDREARQRRKQIDQLLGDESDDDGETVSIPIRGPESPS